MSLTSFRIEELVDDRKKVDRDRACKPYSLSYPSYVQRTYEDGYSTFFLHYVHVIIQDDLSQSVELVRE